MSFQMPAFATLVLIGSCLQADAQTQCMELPRLSPERGAAVPRRGCDAYNRLSVVWGETLRYARDNRESCNISAAALKQFEQRYAALIRNRDNICAGRPLRGFPAEVIRRQGREIAPLNIGAFRPQFR